MGALFRRAFPRERFIVVSNREPYEHRWGEEFGEIVIHRPAGGLISALDPVLQALGGVWIAWGSGDADPEVVDAGNRVRVPPEEEAYTLRRLWLDPREVQGYYLGFSNQFLWPLCHYRPALTRVRARYWERYRQVNRSFADAVLEESGGGPAAVWFQDYHLALAPGMVRERAPHLRLAHFWHIPWPAPEIFRVTPQAGDLLAGLLAADLLGFHLPSYGQNFLRSVEEILPDAEVDRERCMARHRDHVCHVGAFPISIDVEELERAATAPDIAARGQQLRARYAPQGRRWAIGVDRLDYSKGIPERLKALDFLWARYPECRGQLTFLQVAVPSRSDIPAYDDLSRKVERMVAELNERYGTEDWRPVHLIKQSLPASRLAALYRFADICIVSSLHDGMNLVALEYVASQIDGEGALLLSRFTGAAEVLDGYFEVNPYDPEDFARQIHLALNSSVAERRGRMSRLRASLHTIYDWMATIFESWGETGNSPAQQPEATRARA